MIILNLPTITVADLKQSIAQYTAMFLPYMEQLLQLESQADPAALEALASRDNDRVNRAALEFVARKQLPQYLDLEILFGLFVRLVHNLDRLDQIPPKRLLYLAYLDDNHVPIPCPDTIEFVLLRARTDKEFLFLSSS